MYSLCPPSVAMVLASLIEELKTLAVAGVSSCEHVAVLKCITISHHAETLLDLWNKNMHGFSFISLYIYYIKNINTTIYMKI